MKEMEKLYWGSHHEGLSFMIFTIIILAKGGQVCVWLIHCFVYLLFKLSWFIRDLIYTITLCSE